MRVKPGEILDARILFVSMVDKAANGKRFILAKNALPEGAVCADILRVDRDAHYVTGVVYEPMALDADGNYMRAEELKRAAYAFARGHGKVDVQHSFSPVRGVHVVESYIAPCVMTIEGATVPEGAWVVTVEVCNDDVWNAVQSGDITGFSMGGTGVYDDKMHMQHSNRMPRWLRQKNKVEDANMPEEMIKAVVKSEVKAAVQAEMDKLTREVDECAMQDMVREAVQKAMEPLMARRMEPSSLNGEGVYTTNEHYLTGML